MSGCPTVWMIVGQGPIALAVGVGGVVWTFLLSSYLFSPLSPFLWETARYGLKYCLKAPLNPKPTNQPKLKAAMKCWYYIPGIVNVGGINFHQDFV